MTNEVDQPRQGRGRGRPRMPEEDKKRHSITFRMRSELRARYAHQAQQNGFSISEEIERTLEKYFIVSEIIAQRDEIISQLRDSMSSQKDLIQRYADFCENLRQHNEGIISLIGSFIERTVKDSSQSEDIVVNFGKRNEAEELLSQIKKLVDRGSAPTDMLRNSSASKAGLSASEEPVSRSPYPRMPTPADLPPAAPHGGKGFTIAALRDLVAGFTDREPDLEALRAAGWPALFGGLPAGTRTALIGELRDGAPDVYQALMSPTGSHGAALAALRRLQKVLLPRGEDDGPDEDHEDVGGRQAEARR